MPETRDLTISHVSFEEHKEMVLSATAGVLIPEVTYLVHHGTFRWVIERPDRGSETHQRDCPFCGEKLAVEVLSRRSETKERVLRAVFRAAVCVLLMGGAFWLVYYLIGNSTALIIAGSVAVLGSAGFCFVGGLLKKTREVREKGTWVDHNIGAKWKFWQSSLPVTHRRKYGRAPYKLARKDLKPVSGQG